MEKLEFFEKFDKCAKLYLNIECDVEKVEKFYVFMHMLLEKNKVMNLTAITDEEMVIIKHFMDSLELLKLDEVRNAKKFDGYSIVDVGTGAGFPGLPLAIMCPNIQFLLCDSLQKRIVFLAEVVNELGLENVNLSHMRAEDVKPESPYREKFYMAIARGVTKINTLSEYLLPFVKVGGKMAMYKMADCEVEFEEGKNAVKELGAKFLQKIDYELLNTEPKRSILLYEKIKETKRQYPRQGNKPQKEPIR